MAALMKDISVSGTNQALNLPQQKLWLQLKIQQTCWKKATDMKKSF